MRHLNSVKKLGRTASHRQAMLKNLAVSILDKERVTTTIPKAKAVRSLVERLITYGKKNNLSAIRLAARFVNNKTVLKKLFDTLAPVYKERNGGYTRILKLGKRRPGDNTELAIIELVGLEGDVQRKRKKKKVESTPKKVTVKSEANDVVNPENPSSQELSETQS